jgi:hypothetical protein
MRIGVISPQRSDLDGLSKDFPECHFSHGINVMQFVQAAGSNTYNGLVFSDPKLAKEFGPVHHYLRSKHQFLNVPVAVISSEPIVVQSPFEDPMLRNYRSSGGLMLPMVDFFSFIANPFKASSFSMSTDEMVESFAGSLSIQLPQHPQFNILPATDDDLHEEFQTQMGNEIASALLWVKFSARVLSEGSQGMAKELGLSSESEITAKEEEILGKAFSDFEKKILEQLTQAGAILFANPNQFPAAAKLPFLKKVKNTGFTLNSPSVRILLELSRYI